jgi:ribosomal protein S18 acetylase RimI-like enzyme
VICHDWRTCTREEGAALVAREVDAWLAELAWDVRETWRVVEPARRAGHVPGFVVRDAARRIVGWTACTLVAPTWHVFAFSAPNDRVAGLLLDQIAGAAAEAGATRVVFCVRHATPVLRDLLGERGFVVDAYRYLSRSLAAPTRLPFQLRAWRNHDAAMARLCARAYRAAPGVRAFALDDTPEAWDEYIRGLTTTPGCGRFAAELSGVIEGAGQLDAGVMVTRLGPGTLHIAQLAVDPTARGRGLGRSLVDAVEAAGVADGARDITLLVSSGNTPAVSLYQTRGFRDRASFVVAMRQPILSTSLALEMGGASTRL